MSYYRRPSCERFDPFDPTVSRTVATTSMPGEPGVLMCACGSPVDCLARELPDLWAGRMFPRCLECRAAQRELLTSPFPSNSDVKAQEA